LAIGAHDVFSKLLVQYEPKKRIKALRFSYPNAALKPAMMMSHKNIEHPMM